MTLTVYEVAKQLASINLDKTPRGLLTAAVLASRGQISLVEQIEKDFSKKMPPLAKKIVLDMGCGPFPLYTLLAAHQGAKVIACDGVDSTIIEAREVVSKFSPELADQINSWRGSLFGTKNFSADPWLTNTKTWFGDGELDLVILMNVLDLLDTGEERQNACLEISRLVKPGGHVLIGSGLVPPFGLDYSYSQWWAVQMYRMQGIDVPGPKLVPPEVFFADLLKAAHRPFSVVYDDLTGTWPAGRSTLFQLL